MSDSAWEKARKALYSGQLWAGIPLLFDRDLIAAALDAGEKAEKYISELERAVADAKECLRVNQESAREMADELSEVRARISEMETQAKPHD